MNRNKKYNIRMFSLMIIAWSCTFTLGAMVTYNIISSGATKPDGSLFDGLLWLWVLMGVLLAKIPFESKKKGR